MTAEPTTAREPWTPTPTLGDRLRMVRRALSLSQAQFAELIGESRKNYATWESDASAPRQLVAVAQKIENATQVPASWVLGINSPGPDLNVHTVPARKPMLYSVTRTTRVRDLPVETRGAAA